MNTFRKICLSAVFLLTAAVCHAYDAEVGGIYYNLDENEMTATVKYHSSGYTGEIVIPESISVNGKSYSVTSIGTSAFSSCSKLTSVTIPSSVTSIGNNAFRNCTGLKELLIANGDQTLALGYNYKMGNEASSGMFYGCPLQTLYLGRDLSYSYSYNSYERTCSPFYGITSLTTVTIGSTVTAIKDYTFQECSGMKELIIADSNKTLNYGSDTDGRGLFCASSLQTLYLGRNLLYVTNTIYKGENSPFRGNNLSLTIGSNITSIDTNMFKYCSFISINVNSNNTIYDSRDGCNAIIETSTNTLVKGSESTTIPSAIISISDYAFYGCAGLTSIAIPNSVTTIGNNVFNGCVGLTSITIPNSVTTIGDNAFSGCTGVEELIIADGVQTLKLGNQLGWNSDLYGLFRDCPLQTLYLGRNLSYNYNTDSRFKHSPFGGSSSTLNVTIGSSVTSIGDYEFYSCGLTSITIPNSVTSIGNCAFRGCELTSITISNSVTSIGYEAFYGCTGLTSITIPGSITSMGNSAFYGCTGLETITIQDGVTSIGTWAFSDCTGLTSITFPNSMKSIGTGAFQGCSKLETIVLGDFITGISHDAFKNSPAKIYVNKGTYTLLALWNAGVVPYQFGTQHQLTKPYITVLSTTQTTGSFKLHNAENYQDFAYYKGDYDGSELLEGDEWIITDLDPEYNGTACITIYKSVDDKAARCVIRQEYTTNKIGPYLNVSGTASSISATGTNDEGDAEVVKKEIAFNEETYSEGNTLETIGLNPNSRHVVYYRITLKNGRVYSTSSNITTAALTLETEQPKVINTGDVIVKAKSNLNDAETNVGFEWRRTDWTDDFASNTGGAYLYGGEMEGYIRNLNTAYLWKYRPYYVSDSGSHYYGEWVGIDPTNTSYFEPTVHTYDNVSVDGNTAKVRGYAQRGTDNITEQGFVYWKNAAAAKGNGAKSASSVPGGAQTVTVRVSGSNPVIEATLAGLDYNTDYSYMAFVTTDEGTFYGEEKTFKTGGDPTGILDVTAGTPQRSYPAGIYDLNGRKLEKMQRGVNIVRFEDGTVKKIMVK